MPMNNDGKYQKIEEEWVKLSSSVCLLRQSAIKYLEKIQKSSKIGQDKTNLISALACS